MPHQRAVAEPKRSPLFLQTPTPVHIVARRAKLRIEAADGRERVASKRHRASGNVLGLAVREQHMNWSARGVRHAFGDRAVTLRRDIPAADAHVIAALELGDEIL